MAQTAEPDTDAPAPNAEPTDAEERTETKGERTRRRLLEIAIERFGERGFRATSVSEIAREVGLTQAAVYAYFDSKEALFAAAVDTDAADAIASATERTRDVPAAQLVPLLLVFILGSLEDHPLLQRVVGGHEPDTLPRLINLPALAELTELVAERVRAGQEAGEVRPDLDAALFAAGAEAILLSLVMSVTQVGQSTEVRRQMGVLTIFDAVLRPPAPPA